MIEEANLDTQQIEDTGGPPPDPQPTEPSPTEGDEPQPQPHKSPNQIIREMTGQPDQLVEPPTESNPNTLIQAAAHPEQFAKPVTAGQKANAAINQAPLPANPPKQG